LKERRDRRILSTEELNKEIVQSLGAYILANKDDFLPKKGVDYFDGKDGEPGIPGRDGLNGKDGKDGKSGKNGIDGRDGKDGKDGKNGLDGKDAIIPSVSDLATQAVGLLDAKSIVKLLRSLKGKDRLSILDINDPNYGKIDQRWHGGGMSTSKFVSGEVVAGSGTSWTLANDPSLFLGLYAMGQRLSTSRADYTISGADITTGLSWAAGDITADYYQ
jgi:hypothetical protein